MDFSTAIFIVVLQYFIGHFSPLALQVGVSHLFVFVESPLPFSRIANYFDHGKCPRVFAGHVHFHTSRMCGEILTLASDEIATQMDVLFELILGSLEECEDFFGELGSVRFNSENGLVTKSLVLRSSNPGY